MAASSDRTEPVTMTDEELSAVREDLKKLYDEKPCNPLMVRLGWHDAGTYCKDTKTGGPNGTLQYDELSHNANKGLEKALDLLKPVHDKHPKIGRADLWQLASIVAIEHAGGPKIPFRLGRKDCDRDACTPDGRLPDAHQKQQHLRDIFYRMGFNDQEIVALSGAHALGRAHPDRSDFDGPWTTEPLKFDNEYFQNLLEPKEGLLVMPSDQALVEDESMRPWVELYARDKDRFFEDYTKAHHKLSELGMEA